MHTAYIIVDSICYVNTWVYQVYSISKFNMLYLMNECIYYTKFARLIYLIYNTYHVKAFSVQNIIDPYTQYVKSVILTWSES